MTRLRKKGRLQEPERDWKQEVRFVTFAPPRIFFAADSSVCTICTADIISRVSPVFELSIFTPP
jgi:hypothetical protein